MLLLRPAFMLIWLHIANIFILKSRRKFCAIAFSKLCWAFDTKWQKPLAFSVKADQSCCWTISSLPPNIFVFLCYPAKRTATPPINFWTFLLKSSLTILNIWNEVSFVMQTRAKFSFLALISYLCDSMVFKWYNARGCQMSCHLITSSIQSSFQNATTLSICCY